ncbi:MAG: DNA polymerase III subunit gamma/tau [Pyrinomonadaceae bacterium]
MAYQVIARKWRPQTFEEVTGQEAITRTLRNAIEHDRLHHAYLFSGARGVGKTTTARLLAKSLNCHKTDKPNSFPCSPNDATACASCLEIAEGRSIDVLEIDAASNTGVDNVREVIINNLGISPARDRYKVFIIDEVHMLSPSSFNALLKSVEEPPPNVVFIMATTELHKIPDTILSRCQEFDFRTIAAAKIFERLKIIADAEKIDVSGAALREIARSGEGSMRDAQSNFDQVISFSDAKIEARDVMNALGIASSEMLSQTVEAIAAKNAAGILQVVEDLTRRGQDLRSFCRDLLSHFRDLLVAKIAPDADEFFDSAVLSREELSKQTENFTEADLIRFFNSLSETESKLREATQSRYTLEIGLVKLIEMRRVAPLEKILERLTHLESAFANGNSPVVENSSKPIGLSGFAAPDAEKKTLKSDSPPEDAPFPVSSQTARDFPVESNIKVPEKPLIIKTEIPAAANENFIPVISDSFFVRLPPLSAEDLEHIEDNRLDSAYEDKLLSSGETLNVIKTASALVKNALGANELTNDSSNFDSPVSNTAAAFAPAKTPAKPISTAPVFEPEKISDEMPVLPENPTDEDLWKYAGNHPKVKLALRVFRGKITSVSREV